MRILPPDNPTATGTERDFRGKLVDTAIAFADLSMALISLSTPVSGRGLLGVAFQSVAVAAKVHAIWTRPPAVDCAAAFNDWVRLDDDFKFAALGGMRLVGNPVKDHVFTMGGNVVRAAYIAEVDGVELGFVARGRELVIPFDLNSPVTTDDAYTPVFCRNLGALRPMIHRRFWQVAPEGALRISLGGKYEPFVLPADCFTSGELSALVSALRTFVERGVPWTTLFDGEPGTGKSTASVFAARELGLKVVVLEAGHVATTHHGPAEQSTLYQIADIIRPDVVVISDIDRLSDADQVVLLELLDHIKKWAKLVFLSSNHRNWLLDAVDRPGRIDDVRVIHGLSVADIRGFAPHLAEEDAQRMDGWPIAYVINVLQRLQASPESLASEIITQVALRREAAHARWQTAVRGSGKGSRDRTL